MPNKEDIMLKCHLGCKKIYPKSKCSDGYICPNCGNIMGIISDHKTEKY